MALDQYYLLGRYGLRVSRRALGTMNFGTGGFHAAYGKSVDDVRPIFLRYLEAGGNFVDTADFYTAGESEAILGKRVAEADARDRVVLTTKFTNSVDPGNPNAGGNGWDRIDSRRGGDAHIRRPEQGGEDPVCRLLRCPQLVCRARSDVCRREPAGSALREHPGWH